MSEIWKFTLSLADRQIIEMPQGTEILTVQLQNGAICLWAEVPTGQNPEQRQFLIFGTGRPIAPAIKKKYIGTVQDSSGFVWHVFEKSTKSAQ